MTRRFRKLAAAVVAVLAAASVPGAVRAQTVPRAQSVYEYVVTATQGSFEEVSASIQGAVSEAGWRLLATVDSGVPEGCSFRSRVFVLFEESYGRELMAANRKTAPFALVDRVNLFEDERGVHLALVNPHSINRTILLEDHKYQALSSRHLEALRALLGAAVPGKASRTQYGPKRKKGYIGRTMGVMAGGPFDGKIEDEAVVGGPAWQDVARKVRDGLVKKGETWGMHLVYELELPEHETVIFGSTGTPMDSKSFDIVKEGSDGSRKRLKCPGLAHAGAYPIEVVVARDGESVRVRVVNIMYRMKMYFEDAGKWAFMMNMTMPGSIQSELRRQITTALGTR